MLDIYPLFARVFPGPFILPYSNYIEAAVRPSATKPVLSIPIQHETPLNSNTIALQNSVVLVTGSVRISVPQLSFSN